MKYFSFTRISFRLLFIFIFLIFCCKLAHHKWLRIHYIRTITSEQTEKPVKSNKKMHNDSSIKSANTWKRFTAANNWWKMRIAQKKVTLNKIAKWKKERKRKWREKLYIKNSWHFSIFTCNEYQWDGRRSVT